MAFTVVDIISFAVPQAARQLEFQSTGGSSKYLISTDVPPPNSLASSAEFSQDKTNSFARTNTHTFSTGTGADSYNCFSWMVYIEDISGSAWPPSTSNEVPLLRVTDTSGTAIKLNITDNGDGTDLLELIDAAGSTVGSSADVFTMETWYRIDLIFQKDNSGSAMVWVTEWGEDTGAALIDVSAQDFEAGGTTPESFFGGQGGETPVSGVSVFMSTGIIANSLDGEDDLPKHFFDIILDGTQTTGTTPDADETGDTTGTKDTITGTWQATLDGSLATGAYYNDSGSATPHGGMVDCAHPAGSLSNADFVYGASWKFRTLSVPGGGGNMYCLWGWWDGSSTTYHTGTRVNAGTGVDWLNVTVDQSSADCPGVADQFVLGHEWTASSAGTRYCRLIEAWAMVAVRYPLRSEIGTSHSLGQTIGRIDTSDAAGGARGRVNVKISG